MNDVILLFNSGEEELFAAIGATYPEGSGCTCTGKNSGKVLTAKKSPWIFNVPKVDEWTVAASGGNNPSKTVNITHEGQVEKVELVHSLELFTAGSGLASGYGITGHYISPAIDVSNFTKATIVGRLTKSNYSSDFYVGLSADPSSVSSTNVPPACASFAYAESPQTKTIELDGLEGDMYLGIWWSAAYAPMTISASKDKLSVAHTDGTGEITSIIFE